MASDLLSFPSSILLNHTCVTRRHAPSFCNVLLACAVFRDHPKDILCPEHFMFLDIGLVFGGDCQGTNFQSLCNNLDMFASNKTTTFTLAPEPAHPHPGPHPISSTYTLLAVLILTFVVAVVRRKSSYPHVPRAGASCMPWTCTRMHISFATSVLSHPGYEFPHTSDPDNHTHPPPLHTVPFLLPTLLAVTRRRKSSSQLCALHLFQWLCTWESDLGWYRLVELVCDPGFTNLGSLDSYLEKVASGKSRAEVPQLYLPMASVGEKGK
ncbi:hypothetical protein BDQ17DRAFT_1328887 [Cyathus striatus]|nr:hypothetical protein BDQ17DRAFT_1328887 [Cyathus striatus]